MLPNGSVLKRWTSVKKSRGTHWHDEVLSWPGMMRIESTCFSPMSSCIFAPSNEFSQSNHQSMGHSETYKSSLPKIMRTSCWMREEEPDMSTVSADSSSLSLDSRDPLVQSILLLPVILLAIYKSGIE